MLIFVFCFLHEVWFFLVYYVFFLVSEAKLDRLRNAYSHIVGYTYELRCSSSVLIVRQCS